MALDVGAVLADAANTRCTVVAHCGGRSMLNLPLPADETEVSQQEEVVEALTSYDATGCLR